MKNRKPHLLLRKASLFALLLAITLTSLGLDNPSPVFGQDSHPTRQPVFSVDGQTAYTQFSPVVLVVDENPDAQGIRQPNQNLVGATTQNVSGAVFQITFVPAGQTEAYNGGRICQAFPVAVQTAFQAAANIWSQTIRSEVPITIRACWANLGAGILGQSWVDTWHKDFPGAPVSSVWYQPALANSLAGKDLAASKHDMHITFNSSFSWYFGTDSNTPSGQYDLVTVAAHEIGHGLNFAGSGWWDGGTGYLESPPDIYDLFMEDGVGGRLTFYPNPSTSLGNALTSDNLWWNGDYARMANGGARVKMYAPEEWSGGSSYSHLDYDTYRNTINSLMIYALGWGSSQHNSGPVTACLLKDMGWKLVDDSPCGTIFADVPASYWAWDSIERLYTAGITGGCAAGLYCPENPVTRAQMAVFLLKAKYGSSYSPPALGSGSGFNDVPDTHWAARWIKQLAAEGITSGCGAGNYCPETPVTRAQMAVFLVITFNLP